MPPRRSTARAIWIAVWVGLALWLVARAATRNFEKGVILDHLEFGRRLLHGEDPYAPYAARSDEALHPLHPPYPPSFGVLAAPFALVAGIDAVPGPDGRPDLRTSRLARIAWALIQILSLWVIARCLMHWRPALEPPHPWPFAWLFAFTVVVCGRFILRDTHGGGGNLINVALCLGAFRDAQRQHPARAGLWFGLSLATKPSLLWVLPVLWLFGYRRATAATILWGILAALASWVMLHCDIQPWLRWLEGTFRFSTQADAFAEPAFAFPDFTWMNHSLRCALARYLGEVPPRYAADVWGFFPGLGLAATAVAWVNRLCTVTLLAGLFVAARRARADAAARPLVIAAALVVSLLLSPLSWTGHHVAALPAWFLLLQHGCTSRARWVFVLVAACIPAWALGEEITGKALKNTLQSLYLMTAMDLALLWGLLRLHREQTCVTAAGP